MSYLKTRRQRLIWEARCLMYALKQSTSEEDRKLHSALLVATIANYVELEGEAARKYVLQRLEQVRRSEADVGLAEVAY